MITQLGWEKPACFDVTGTLAAMNVERDMLQAAFDAEQSGRTKSKRMVTPEWPMFPEPIDVDNPPLAKSPDPTQRALAIARWLSTLCHQWEYLEEERLARPMLRGLSGLGSRALPLVVAS